MEKTIKLEEKELNEIQGIKEENSRLTVEFGKVKLDLIMLKARLMEVEKMESDMEARFKGNMTKEKKMLDTLQTPGKIIFTFKQMRMLETIKF